MQRVVNDYYVVMKHRWDSGERLQPNVGSYRAFSFEVSVLAMALFTQRSRTTRILQSPITERCEKRHQRHVLHRPKRDYKSGKDKT